MWSASLTTAERTGGWDHGLHRHGRRGSTSTGRGTEDGTSAATGRADPAVVRRRGGPGAFAIADRRLPTGRATVGAALIVIAAAGVFVAHRAANEPPSTDYIVRDATRSGGSCS